MLTEAMIGQLKTVGVKYAKNRGMTSFVPSISEEMRDWGFSFCPIALDEVVEVEILNNLTNEVEVLFVNQSLEIVNVALVAFADIMEEMGF
jgi:hypothetical protein